MTETSAMTTARKTTGADVLVALLLSPFYAAWGLVVLVGGLVWFARRIEGAQAALGSTIRCAHGHENPTTGRFECGGCRATYVGWVGRCPICGAGAAWMTCSVCSVSIRLPWER